MAGFAKVPQIAESAFDIRATGRLNQLYVELLTDNPEWGTAAPRHDMNHFMARLIFCFFAEDTDIFNGPGLFTATVEQMRDASNTDFVIGEIFRAMNTPTKERATSGLRPWADRLGASSQPRCLGQAARSLRSGGAPGQGRPGLAEEGSAGGPAGGGLV